MSEFNFTDANIKVNPKTGGLYLYIKNEASSEEASSYLYISLNQHDFGYLYCADNDKFEDNLKPVSKISADKKPEIASDGYYHMQLPLKSDSNEYKNVKCYDTIVNLEGLRNKLRENNFFGLCRSKIVKKIKCSGNFSGDGSPVGKEGYLLKKKDSTSSEEYFMTSDFKNIYVCESRDGTAKIDNALKYINKTSETSKKPEDVSGTDIISSMLKVGSNFFDTLEYVGTVKSSGSSDRDPSGVYGVPNEKGRLFRQLQFDGKTYEYYFFNVDTKRMFKCKVDNVKKPKKAIIEDKLDGQCVNSEGKLQNYINDETSCINNYPYQFAAMSNAVIQSLKLKSFKIVEKPLDKGGILNGMIGTVLKSDVNEKFYMLLSQSHLLVDCGDENPIEKKISNGHFFNRESLAFDANFDPDNAFDVSNLSTMSEFLIKQRIFGLSNFKLIDLSTKINEFKGGDLVNFCSKPLMNHKGIFLEDKHGKAYLCDFTIGEFIRFRDKDGNIVYPKADQVNTDALDLTGLTLEILDGKKFNFVDYDEKYDGKKNGRAVWEREGYLRDVFASSNKKVLENIVDFSNLEYVDYGTIRIDGKEFKDSTVFKGGKDGKERYIFLADKRFLKSGNINSDDDIFADISNVGSIVLNINSFKFDQDFDKNGSGNWRNDDGPVYRLFYRNESNTKLAQLNLKPVTSGKVNIMGRSLFGCIFSGGTDNKERYILFKNGKLLKAGNLDVSNPLNEVGEEASDKFFNSNACNFNLKVEKGSNITDTNFYKTFHKRQRVNMKVLGMDLKIVDFGPVNITGLGIVDGCTVFVSNGYFYVYEPSSNRFIKSNKIDGSHKPLDDTPNIREQDVVLQKDGEFRKDNEASNVDFSTIAGFEFLIKRDKNLALKLKELDLKPVYSNTENVNGIITSGITDLPEKEKITVCVGKDLDNSNSERYYIVCDGRLIMGNKLSDNILPYKKVEGASLFNKRELKFEASVNYKDNNFRCEWLEDFIASLEPANMNVSKLDLKVAAYGNILTNSGENLGECLILAGSGYYYVLTEDNRLIRGNEIKDHSPFDKITLDKVLQKDGSFKENSNESNADTSKLKSIEILKRRSEAYIVIAKLNLKPVAYGKVKFVANDKSRERDNCTIFVGKDGDEEFYFILTKTEKVQDKKIRSQLIKGAKVSEGKGPFADIQNGTCFDDKKCGFSGNFNSSPEASNFTVILTLLKTEETGIVLAKLNLKPVAYGTVQIGVAKKDNCTIFVGKDKNNGNKDFYFVLTEDGKLVKGKEVSENSNPFDSIDSNNCFDGKNFNAKYDEVEAINVSEALKRRLDSSEKLNLTIAKLNLKPVAYGAVKIGNEKKDNCTIFVGKDGNEEFCFVLTKDGKLVKGIELSKAVGVSIANIVDSDKKFFNRATCSFDKEYSNTDDNDKVDKTEAFKTLTDKLEKVNLAIAKLNLKPVAYGTVIIGMAKKDNCTIFVGKDKNDGNKDFYFVLTEDGKLIKGKEVSENSNPFDYIDSDKCFDGKKFNAKYDEVEAINVSEALKRRLDSFEKLNLTIAKLQLKPVTRGTVKIGGTKKDNCTIFVGKDGNEEFCFVLTKDGKLVKGIKLSDAKGVSIANIVDSDKKFFNRATCSFDKEDSNTDDNDKVDETEAFKTLTDKLEKVNLAIAKLRLKPVAYGKVIIGGIKEDCTIFVGKDEQDGADRYFIIDGDNKLVKGAKVSDAKSCFDPITQSNDVVFNENSGKFDEEYGSHCSIINSAFVGYFNEYFGVLDIAIAKFNLKLVDFGDVEIDGVKNKDCTIFTGCDGGLECCFVLTKNGKFGKCKENNKEDHPKYNAGKFLGSHGNFDKKYNEAANVDDVFVIQKFRKEADIKENLSKITLKADKIQLVKTECDDKNAGIHGKYAILLTDGDSSYDCILLPEDLKIYKGDGQENNGILNVKDPSNNEIVLNKNGEYGKANAGNLLVCNADNVKDIKSLSDIVNNEDVKKMLNFAKFSIKGDKVKLVKINCDDTNAAIHNKYGILLTDGTDDLVLYGDKIYKGDGQENNEILNVKNPSNNEIVLNENGEYGKANDDNLLVCNADNVKDIKSLSDIFDNEDVKKMLNFAKFSIKGDEVKLVKINCDDTNAAIHNKYGILLTDGTDDLVLRCDKIYKGDGKENNGILNVKDPRNNEIVLNKNGKYGKANDDNLLVYKKGDGVKDIKSLSDIFKDKDVRAMARFASICVEKQVKQVKIKCNNEKAAIHNKYGVMLDNKHVFYNGKIYKYEGKENNGILEVKDPENYEVVLNKKNGYGKISNNNLIIDESIGIDPLLDIIKNTEVNKMLNFAKVALKDGKAKLVKIKCDDEKAAIHDKYGVLLSDSTNDCVLYGDKIYKGNASTDGKTITVAALDNDVILQKSGQFGKGDDQVVNDKVDIKSLSDIVNNEDVKKMIKLAKFGIEGNKAKLVKTDKGSYGILLTDGNSDYDCVLSVLDGNFVIYKGDGKEKDGEIKINTDVLQASGDFGSGSDLDLKGIVDIGNLEDIVNIAVPELAIADLELEYKSNAKDKSNPAHDGFYFISKDNRHFFYDNNDKKIIECDGAPNAGIVSFASDSKYLNLKTGEFDAKAGDSPTHPENNITALKKVMVKSGVLAGFEFVDPQPEGMTGKLFKCLSDTGESYIIRTEVNGVGAYQPCNKQGKPSDENKFLIKGCLKEEDGSLDNNKTHENNDLLGDNDIPALKYQFELSNRISEFKLDADSKFIGLAISHDDNVKGVVVNVKNNGVFDSSEKKYCVTENYKLYELNSEGNSVVGNQKKIIAFNSVGVFKVEDCVVGNDNIKLTFDDLNKIGVVNDKLFTYGFINASEFVKSGISGLKVVLKKPGRDNLTEELYLKKDDWGFYKEETFSSKAFVNLSKASIDDDDSKGGKSELKDLEVIKNKLESEGYIVYSIDEDPQKKDDLSVGGNKINGYVFKLKNPYGGTNKYVYLAAQNLADNSIKKGDLLLMTDENTLDLNGTDPKFVKFDGLNIGDGGKTGQGIYLNDPKGTLKVIKDKAIKTLQEFKLEFEVGNFEDKKIGEKENVKAATLQVKIGDGALGNPKLKDSESELDLYVLQETTKLVDSNGNEYKISSDGFVSKVEDNEIYLLKDLKDTASKLEVGGKDVLSSPNDMPNPSKLVYGKIGLNNDMARVRLVNGKQDEEVDIDKAGNIYKKVENEKKKLVLDGPDTPKFEDLSAGGKFSLRDYVDPGTNPEMSGFQTWFDKAFEKHLKSYDLIAGNAVKIEKEDSDLKGQYVVPMTIKNKFKQPFTILIIAPTGEIYKDTPNPDERKNMASNSGKLSIGKSGDFIEIVSDGMGINKLDFDKKENNDLSAIIITTIMQHENLKNVFEKDEFISVSGVDFPKKIKFRYSLDDFELKLDKYGRALDKEDTDGTNFVSYENGVLSKVDADKATNVRDLEWLKGKITGFGLVKDLELTSKPIKIDDQKVKIALTDIRGNSKDLIITKGEKPGDLKFIVNDFKINYDGKLFEASNGDNTIDGEKLLVSGNKKLINAVKDEIVKYDDLKKILGLDNTVVKKYKTSGFSVENYDKSNDFLKVNLIFLEGNDEKVEPFLVDKEKKSYVLNSDGSKGSEVSFKFDEDKGIVSGDGGEDILTFLKNVFGANVSEEKYKMIEGFNGQGKITYNKNNITVESEAPGFARVELLLGDKSTEPETFIYIDYPSYKLFKADTDGKKTEEPVNGFSAFGNSIKFEDDGDQMVLTGDIDNDKELDGLKKILDADNGVLAPKLNYALKETEPPQNLTELGQNDVRVQINVEAKVAGKLFDDLTIFMDKKGKFHKAAGDNEILKAPVVKQGKILFEGNLDLGFSDLPEDLRELLKDFINKGASYKLRFILGDLDKDKNCAKVTVTLVDENDQKVEGSNELNLFAAADENGDVFLYEDDKLEKRVAIDESNKENKEIKTKDGDFKLTEELFKDDNSKNVFKGLQNKQEQIEDNKLEFNLQNEGKTVDIEVDNHKKAYYVIKATWKNNVDGIIFFLIGKDNNEHDVHIAKTKNDNYIAEFEEDPVSKLEIIDNKLVIERTSGNQLKFDKNNCPDDLKSILKKLEGFEDISDDYNQDEEVKFELCENGNPVEIEKDGQKKICYVVKATKNKFLLIDKVENGIYEGRYKDNTYEITSDALSAVGIQNGKLVLKTGTPILNLRDPNVKIPDDLRKVLSGIKDLELSNQEIPTNKNFVYELKRSDSKLWVKKIESKTVDNKKGNSCDLMDKDGKLIARVFFPDNEDIIYDETGKKKIKIDEKQGKIEEVKNGEDGQKLSDSAILLDAITRYNVFVPSVTAEAGKPEAKIIKDENKVKIKLDGKEEEIDLAFGLKHNISLFKSKDGENIYFDNFNFMITDENGSVLPEKGKLTQEKVGKRLLKVGDYIYDLAKYSPAEMVNFILNVINKEDYNELSKYGDNVKEMVLMSLYSVDDAKKYYKNLEEFIEKYDIFNTDGKVDIVKARKVLGDKFCLLFANKWICLPISILTGVSSGVFAALFFSGAVTFPFALPVAIAIISGTGALSIGTGISTVTDKVLAIKNQKKFGVNKVVHGILSKIKKSPVINEKDQKGQPRE